MRTVPIGKYTVSSSVPLTFNQSLDCAFAIVELDPFSDYSASAHALALVSDTSLTPQYIVDNGQTVTQSTTLYCGNINQLWIAVSPGGTCTVRVFAVVTGG